MHLTDTRSGLEVIPRVECLQLLDEHRVGRLVIGAGGTVDVFPVNYGLDGTYIVIRTADGTKWRDGPGGAVAFEVDQLDEETCTGWSVVVHGFLEPLQDDHPSGILAQPWAEGDKPHVLRLVPDSITGRRISPR